MLSSRCLQLADRARMRQGEVPTRMLPRQRSSLTKHHQLSFGPPQLPRRDMYMPYANEERPVIAIAIAQPGPGAER
jgi:hypothetical protein